MYYNVITYTETLDYVNKKQLLNMLVVLLSLLMVSYFYFIWGRSHSNLIKVVPYTTGR
jgi:hypothetical protein